MQFALDHADTIEKLIVVDIGPKVYPGGHQLIFEALLDIDLTTLASRAEADELLQSRIPEYSVRQFLLKNLSRAKEGGFRWKMNLTALHENYSDILSNIKLDEPFDGPALFIKGERSAYLEEEDIALIQEYFPNAQLETIKDAGHWIHADQPQALFDLVQNFLHPS